MSTEVNEDSSNALVNLFAKFNLSIDRLSDRIDRQNQLEQRRLAGMPNGITFPRLSLIPAGGTDVVEFNGPPPGRVWIVRMLGAIASPLGANASVVTWYVGQNMPGPAVGQLPATMARWQFATVPAFQNFTADVIRIKSGEHLIAGITGAPAGSSLALIAAVNDQPEYIGAPVTIE